MSKQLCRQCEQRPAGLRKKNRIIRNRGFDLCQACEDRNKAKDKVHKPKYSKRKPIIETLDPSDFEADRIRFSNGILPVETYRIEYLNRRRVKYIYI
ncbi:MAG: hypothetical protein L3J07_03460 [Candidatus Magasanikbacteria bacterium]|nr:hypothetical protein [Candidatus Magasanikbacteria bacterium]